MFDYYHYHSNRKLIYLYSCNRGKKWLMWPWPIDPKHRPCTTRRGTYRFCEISLNCCKRLWRFNVCKIWLSRASGTLTIDLLNRQIKRSTSQRLEIWILTLNINHAQLGIKQITSVKYHQILIWELWDLASTIMWQYSTISSPCDLNLWHLVENKMSCIILTMPFICI